MNYIKTNFDIGIAMIESGESEKTIMDKEKGVINQITK